MPPAMSKVIAPADYSRTAPNSDAEADETAVYRVTLRRGRFETSVLEEFRGSADANAGGSKLLREFTVRCGSYCAASYPTPGPAAGGGTVDAGVNRDSRGIRSRRSASEATRNQEAAPDSGTPGISTAGAHCARRESRSVGGIRRIRGAAGKPGRSASSGPPDEPRNGRKAGGNPGPRMAAASTRPP